MCPFELIHLSMTSKRMKRVVTIISKPKIENKFEIDAYINEDYGVSIKNGQMTWDYRFVALKYRDGWNESENSEQLRKYTKNKLEGFKTVCDCIQDAFGLQFNNFIFSMEVDHNQNRSTVDYLKIRQESYTQFELRSVSENDEDIKYLLDNLKFSNYLYIKSDIKKDFEMDIPENVDSLNIVFADFVKLEQLLRLNCGCIKLWHTNLTKRDINVFLKSWTASGSNLNLVYCKIGFAFQRTDGILDDIPHEVGNERRFQNKYIDQVVQNGWDIKRNDGKTARIHFRSERAYNSMDIIIY
ncbi:hypothetical protein CAEBREN_05756 [Caenorhabditis brenneri]|uniref:Sdz-33 F-box domain-containing protein n=1 Tax=Caenorhabditis brenneri TaxID=135651 RepID=G0NZM1_CAEBE|nr:hypothetical protein CAEBREN_05756 [Caenorhabditis brenneri]